MRGPTVATLAVMPVWTLAMPARIPELTPELRLLTVAWTRDPAATLGLLLLRLLVVVAAALVHCRVRLEEAPTCSWLV